MSMESDLLTAMRTVLGASFKFPVKSAQTGVYATYQRITGRRHGTLNSGLGAPVATFQIDVWGKAGGSAIGDVVEALKEALPDSLKVGDINDNPDDYETDTQLHRASFDVTIWQR
jgi:hypothetical protein